MPFVCDVECLNEHSMNGTIEKTDIRRPSVTLSIEASSYAGQYNRDALPSASQVAQYLLDQGFYLTALEFHFEQLDRGICLSQLNGFFSNASFFENIHAVRSEGIPSLARCPSVSTLDSIDMGRISDDGNSLEEKLKVLEYELRKKNAEIQTLRSELTNMTVGRSLDENTSANASRDPTHNICGSADVDQQIVHPHEYRALCILINDFLLQHNYRITAVQFVEESESAGLQSVSAWDQVGINLDKPPNLLHLLRFYWRMSTGNGAVDDCSRVAASPASKLATFSAQVSHESKSTSCDLQAILDELSTLKSGVIQWNSKCVETTTQSDHCGTQDLNSQRDLSKCPSVRTPTSDLQEVSVPFTTSVPLSGSPVNESVESGTTVAKASAECTGNPPLNARYTSAGFRKHITDMLPHCEFSLNSDYNAFNLATSLNEFVVLVSSRLESTLPSMSDEGKIANLPLLTQVICLHPDSCVRDRLTRLLLNLFSHPVSTHSNYVSDVSDSHTPSVRRYSGSHHLRLLILHACRRLASYLGPARLENEFIPHLWSQLNEHPTPPAAQRLLLVSACGVIAPQISAHLQSSLLLSILESNLDDERDELVRAASIRSLACLAGIMSEQNKLPRLVQRMNTLLAGYQIPSIRLTDDCHSSVGNSSEPMGFSLVPSMPTFVTTVEWLLPALSQWCLELDSLHTMLLNSWIDHLDAYISAARSTDAIGPLPHDMVIHTLGVLDYLVPFLHAWVMVTLFKPESGQTYWSTAMNWFASTDTARLSPSILDLNEPVDVTVNVRLLLGSDVYSTLQPLFQLALEQVTDGNTTSDPLPPSLALLSDTIAIDNWTAKNWLDNTLLSKLVDILASIPKQTTKTASIGCVYNHGELLETFVVHQFDENFASPWSSSPKADYLGVCLSVCQFLSTFGHSVGPVGVQKLLGLPLRNALMNKTKLGNFEYNHQAIQTGLLAGYCCLLSSVNLKSEWNKARVLLTNAIFLQVREGYGLDSIRLAIWCLCRISDVEHTVAEVVLPALRTCVSCADCMVRRAAATLLHTLVGALQLFQPSGVDKSGLGHSVLDALFQLVSQLARDDITGQRRLINPDEADWSVLAVSLGPLYNLWTLCRAQSIQTLPITVNSDVPATSTDVNSSCPKIATDVEEQLYEVIELQFNLVIGMSDPTKLSLHTSGAINEVRPDQLLITQQRFWSVLTSALLSFTDHILPSCSSRFRDTVILPWLCHLAELNNALPDLDSRARLADRLFVVFSTAAYSTHVEESLLHWLVPGLDRVRLDLVEAGDHARTHEVEQFLNDIYSRIKADDKYFSTTRREPTGGLRNAVTSQLAKLTNRGSTNAVSASVLNRTSETESRTYLKTKASKLSVRKRGVPRQESGLPRK